MGLKWHSVDFKDNLIRIENNLLYEKDRGVYDEIHKTGKMRSVKLQPATMSLLKQYKHGERGRLKSGDYCHNTGYVFARETGRQCTRMM